MNYNIKENREKALENIEANFIIELKKISNRFTNNLICNVYESSIELGVIQMDKEDNSYYGRMAFASDVRITTKRRKYGSIENEMSVGSSGSVNPNYIAGASRIINAAEILHNWDAVIELVEKTCQNYKDTEKEILAYIGANPE